MTDYIQDTIDAAKLSLSCSPVSEDRYLCTATGTLGQMVRELRMQPGMGPPTIGQFLYYYANRVQLVDACDDSLEWADECGLDIGDPAVLDDYRARVQDLDDLRAVLGDTIVRSMLGGLAIDQAVSSAGNPGT